MGGPGAGTGVQLHRVNGEFITRSLDELTELRPLVVGLRSADSGAERVLEIRFGDERYRTSSRYATEDNDVWRLRDALRRSCPQARTLPLQDTSRWVSDVI
jgi:hypothetical protein